MPIKIRRALLAVATLAGVAGCAVPGPAPVEPRTRPVAPAVRTPAPPPAVAAPAPPPAAAATPRAPADAPPVIQSVPVRPATMQSRSLGPPEPRATVPPSLVRSQPSGAKRPYSDAAWAELRASAAQALAPAVPAAPAAGADAAAPRPDAPAADTRPAPAAPAAPVPPAVASAAPPGAVPPPAADPAAAPARPGDGPGFAWPARGRVLQGFSEPSSMGIAIAGNLGEPVIAAADGRVIFSGLGPRGYGNLVIVKHDADTLSVYAHNRNLLVKEGDNVSRGQRIAELGDSGTDRPKLHFEIRKAGKPVDPLKFLPAR